MPLHDKASSINTKPLLQYCTPFFCYRNSWINIWETSDGVWQKCHFSSQFSIKYEASCYTLISVYWFHWMESIRHTQNIYFHPSARCFLCGRVGEFQIHFPLFLSQFVSNFHHAQFLFLLRVLFSNIDEVKGWWKLQVERETISITQTPKPTLRG